MHKAPLKHAFPPLRYAWNKHLPRSPKSEITHRRNQKRRPNFIISTYLDKNRQLTLMSPPNCSYLFLSKYISLIRLIPHHQQLNSTARVSLVKVSVFKVFCFHTPHIDPSHSYHSSGNCFR
eukprot:GHVN01074429.1.p1 GENE.GHVN01074429.1~~GHVN01074429.1.p1  ORF type:complete len:136 (+),score=18.99 GHVN01074429.1:47-409(+)